jgi:hypothetical protein
MHTTARLAATTAALLALGACSTPPAGPAAMAAAPTAAATAAEGSITGSRIPTRNTDRYVRSTDNAGARQMDRERPPMPGPVSN